MDPPIVRANRDRPDQLFGETDTERAASERRIRQQPVVESLAPTQPRPFLGESDPGNERQIHLRERHLRMPRLNRFRHPERPEAQLRKHGHVMQSQPVALHPWQTEPPRARVTPERTEVRLVGQRMEQQHRRCRNPFRPREQPLAER